MKRLNEYITFQALIGFIILCAAFICFVSQAGITRIVTAQKDDKKIILLYSQPGTAKDYSFEPINIAMMGIVGKLRNEQKNHIWLLDALSRRNAKLLKEKNELLNSLVGVYEAKQKMLSSTSSTTTVLSEMNTEDNWNIKSAAFVSDMRTVFYLTDYLVSMYKMPREEIQNQTWPKFFDTNHHTTFFGDASGKNDGKIQLIQACLNGKKVGTLLPASTNSALVYIDNLVDISQRLERLHQGGVNIVALKEEFDHSNRTLMTTLDNYFLPDYLRKNEYKHLAQSDVITIGQIALDLMNKHSSVDYLYNFLCKPMLIINTVHSQINILEKIKKNLQENRLILLDVNIGMENTIDALVKAQGFTLTEIPIADEEVFSGIAKITIALNGFIG